MYSLSIRQFVRFHFGLEKIYRDPRPLFGLKINTTALMLDEGRGALLIRCQHWLPNSVGTGLSWIINNT